MSLKQILENAADSKSESDDEESKPNVDVSMPGFSGSKPSLTTDGPFTEREYRCIAKSCQDDDCDETILHIVEPEYNLEVGIDMSVPVELIFTRIEGDVVEDGADDFWRKNNLSTDDAYAFDCPECGCENRYNICTDGGLLVLTLEEDHDEVRIPKNRVAYLQTPQSEWEESVSDGEE